MPPNLEYECMEYGCKCAICEGEYVIATEQPYIHYTQCA